MSNGASWEDEPDIAPAAARGAVAPSWENEPSVAPGATPSILQSLARGGAQGATFGFADELAGAYDALADLGAPGSFGERYRKGRDESRSAYKAAQKANPNAYLTGELGAGLATLPLGGAAAKGATMAGRLGLSALGGAGLGGLSAAGGSEADTTKQLIKDIALGGAVGLGTGALGAGVGEAGRFLKGKAAAAVTKAEEKIAQKAAEKQAKAVASAAGELGAESQQMSTQLRNLMRNARDPHIDPALRQDAINFLASPEGVRLREKALRSTLRDAPGQVESVLGKEATLKALREAAAENIAGDIAKGKSLGETFKTQVAPRFATMGSRVIPPLVAAGLGGLAGGEEHRGAGIGAGATLGSLLSATMGNPSTVIRNMVRAPSVQRAAAMGLERMAAPLATAAPALGVSAASPLARWLAEAGVVPPEDEPAP